MSALFLLALNFVAYGMEEQPEDFQTDQSPKGKSKSVIVSSPIRPIVPRVHRSASLSILQAVVAKETLLQRLGSREKLDELRNSSPRVGASTNPLKLSDRKMQSTQASDEVSKEFCDERESSEEFSTSSPESSGSVQEPDDLSKLIDRSIINKSTSPREDGEAFLAKETKYQNIRKSLPHGLSNSLQNMPVITSDK